MATEETSPQAAASTARLVRYWAHGPGRLKIKPEAEGAFARCKAELGKHITNKRILEGFCARVIHEATGMWPGENHKHHKGA